MERGHACAQSPGTHAVPRRPRRPRVGHRQADQETGTEDRRYRERQAEQRERSQHHEQRRDRHPDLVGDLQAVAGAAIDGLVGRRAEHPVVDALAQHARRERLVDAAAPARCARRGEPLGVARLDQGLGPAVAALLAQVAGHR